MFYYLVYALADKPVSEELSPRRSTLTNPQIRKRVMEASAKLKKELAGLEEIVRITIRNLGKDTVSIETEHDISEPLSACDLRFIAYPPSRKLSAGQIEYLYFVRATRRGTQEQIAAILAARFGAKLGSENFTFRIQTAEDPEHQWIADPLQRRRALQDGWFRQLQIIETILSEAGLTAEIGIVYKPNNTL